MDSSATITLIGQQLIRKGLISQDQLEEALAFQKNIGGRLGKILQKLGSLDEESFARFLAGEYGHPYSSFESLTPTPGLLSKYPRELMRDKSFVPIRRSPANLSVAMSDPTDCETIDLLTQREGRRIEITVVSSRTVERVLHEQLDMPLLVRFPEDGPEDDGLGRSREGAPGELPGELSSLPAEELLHALIRTLAEKNIVSFNELLGHGKK